MLGASRAKAKPRVLISTLAAVDIGSFLARKKRKRGGLYGPSRSACGFRPTGSTLWAQMYASAPDPSI